MHISQQQQQLVVPAISFRATAEPNMESRPYVNYSMLRDNVGKFVSVIGKVIDVSLILTFALIEKLIGKVETLSEKAKQQAQG